MGVAPTFSPDEDSIVTLCGSEELLVKSTDTLPALALSDFVLYSSWPSGFASRLTFEEPPEVVAGADVDVAAELVVGASAAVLAEELELDELPHPASAIRAAASTGVAIEKTVRLRAEPAAWNLTVRSSIVGVVGSYDTARCRSFPVAEATGGRHRRPSIRRADARGHYRGGAMELERAIRTRRTHKAFGADALDAATLDELFELARWAPNHHLTNPWRFRVLGARTRERLMELAETAQPGSAVKLRRAPTLVAVSATTSGDAAQDREDLLAGALAAYIVLLGAHARGLAGYWRTVPLLEQRPARELLRIGDDETALGLLYLGTPVQEQRVPERAPVQDFVTYLD